MQISTSYNVGNIFDLDAVQKYESQKKYGAIQSQTTPSGDSVDISEEAKRLFSEAIHKYDGAAQATNSTQDSPESVKNEETGQPVNSGSASPQGGGGAQSSDSSSVENIKKQIQSLKSQLTALANQAGNGMDSAVQGKMDALQAQISALEAQLNEMA